MRIHGPVFTLADAPEWTGATWVGEVFLDDAARIPSDEPPSPARLDAADGFSKARFIVRDRSQVRGFVTLDLRDGDVDTGQLRSAIHQLPQTPDEEPVADGLVREPFSVVLCTRERPTDLRIALDSLTRQEYAGDVEIVVVDNAPVTDGTRQVVADVQDARVRIVTEPLPGLSHARNAGVAAARHGWIAFTDDDVVTDPLWLEGLARGFARGGADAWCVTGLVPTGELRTASQSWFDQRIGWSNALQPRIFTLRRPPADIPYFPFQVGRYGTGANFAARRSAVERVGGFDPHLGAGTRSKGGEDLDFFYRVIARGGSLVYEPSAFVWHRHRETLEALESQAVGYGRGLAAWGTKLLLSPVDLARGLRVLARSESRTLAPLRTYRRAGAPEAPLGHGPEDTAVSSIEHRALLSGPWAYVGSRFFGR